MIAEGERAPDFTLPDQDGEPVTLSDLAGRPVVLYFYPKADTRGTIDSHDRDRPPSHRHHPRLPTQGSRGPELLLASGSADAIEAFCRKQDWTLVDEHDEQHVSGNALLKDRPGLSQAVTAVMTGAAEIIVGAHSERLWWSHEVRAQVLRLVENAGGEVWAADSGQLSNGSAAEDFNGEVRTSADRFSRRQNAEKSRTAVERAVARGVVPWPNIPPGYDGGGKGKGKGEPLVPNSDAGTVAEAFRMRAGGATVAAVRAFLAERGVRRSQHGVGSMLESRLYLGEIHFGTLANLSAHPALVDRETFNRVQRMVVPRGRKAKSERLLARLGVLRCGTCGARMVVGTSNNSGYYLYRCPPNGDCKRRVTISAETVETIVIDRARAALADAEGRASVEDNAREAEAQLERAEANLKAAIRTFDGWNEQAAVDRLDELRAVRDHAQEDVDHLGGHRSVVKINAAEDWDRLSLDARRALIRATVAEVRVAPGRGADRVTVELVGE